MLTTLPEEEQQQELRTQQEEQPQPQQQQQQQQCQQQRVDPGSSGSGSSSFSSFCEGAQQESAASSRSTSCEDAAPLVPRRRFASGSSGSTASLGSAAGPARRRRVVPERTGGGPALEHRYRLSAREAGRGGFGQVFLAEDREVPGRRVAIKRILPAGLGDRQAFEREVGLMKQLDHPSICSILETYVSGRALYIVMEPCRGGDVFERVSRRGPLGEDTAADVIRQVAGALKYIHDLGIAHRDIKPENVCFCSAAPADTSVKVIDWGTGFRVREGGMRTAVGSFAYAAPEMRGTAVYTEACDLWSLGVMTYVVLSGLPPFWGSQENQIKSMDAERYPLSDVTWQTKSDEAKDLIRSLIRARPKERLSAEDVVAHPWLRARGRQNPEEVITQQLFYNMRRFASSSPSLATFATVVAKHLDHRTHEELKRVFDALDANGDGVIGFDEWRKGFRSVLGANSEDLQDLEAVFAHLDLDGLGAISYTSFVAAALGESTCATDEALLAAFHDFDTNDGVRHELSRVSASSMVAGVHPESELTIQEWLHRVREPLRKKKMQPFPFEVQSSASTASSRCSTSFFRKACEALSGRTLGSGRLSSARSAAVQDFPRQACFSSVNMMPHAGLLIR